MAAVSSRYQASVSWTSRFCVAVSVSATTVLLTSDASIACLPRSQGWEENRASFRFRPSRHASGDLLRTHRRVRGTL